MSKGRSGTTGTSRRLTALLSTLVAAAALLALPAASAAAPSPWWQILDGSRPSNLWIPEGGSSGRLILTVTNLGNASVDATGTPVTIVDELPEGVVASGVEASSGQLDKFGPVDCEVKAPDLVECVFEKTLPPYEAIEIDVIASLTGEPPVAGAPGEVTVSGGNAPPKTASQEITVSPNETPFGIERFSGQAEEEGGAVVSQAGRHPFQLTTTIQFNAGDYHPGANRRNSNVDQPAIPRNFRSPLPAGFVGKATAVPTCLMTDFFETAEQGSCPPQSAIGVASATVFEKLALGFARLAVPVFNLEPQFGQPARLGVNIEGTPVVIDIEVDPNDQYRVIASVTNSTQVAKLLSTTLVIWGTPGDPAHDASRGWACVQPKESLGPCERPPALGEEAFLRVPVSCQGPIGFGIEVEPWNVPLGSTVAKASSEISGMSGCNQVPFDPEISAATTTKAATSPSGLQFHLEMPNAGLADKDAISEGQAKKVEVTLPEGVTVNPSQAEGLGACSPSDYAKETLTSSPGQGCPEASKVASVAIKTPLIDEEAQGSVYIAKPYDNPFDSLLALYMVARIPERGVLVKQAGRIDLDPVTGQLTSTFDELPEVPFSSFELTFFGGGRAPLVMPPKCGDYEITARFTPWSASDPDNPLPSEIVTRTTPFTVDQGPNGTPCPSGTPPFKPEFIAGTLNNAAGSHSPLFARLTRQDDEAEFSRFSMRLPKGVVGSLVGIPFCSDLAIAAARLRTGPHGGQEELDNPSCPSASYLGRVLVGAGVGPELTYAPGRIYLAGPYQGQKLSIVAISTATVGPFDLGTVVIRQALRVDSETAEVTTDGAASEPIPRILAGVVTHARQIKIYVDRPNFILNPTNCDRLSAAATVLGQEGQSAQLTSPFQAADCGSLGFKPKLSLKFLGGTKRGDTPRLRAELKARPGDANIGRAQVTLPKSTFLEQAHIRTICTRVQFRAGNGNGEQCPKASVYGRASAITPLLDEPLEGPVFLRSSDNELPDLVMALHSGKADFNLVARMDSLNGRIRATVQSAPDVPVTKFVLEMQGGDKGLIVNSQNMCRGRHRAIAAFKGQNGRRYDFKPVVKVKCGGKGANGKGGARRG